MDLKFSEADIAFRQDVVDFLNSEYPEDIKEKQDKRIPLEKEEIVRWQKILNEKGWFTINWPVEYSGQEELTVTQKYILQEELAKANTPTTIPFGMGMCAPVIYTFGTDEQKQKYANIGKELYSTVDFEKCLKISRYPIIIFCDQDDIWKKNNPFV